jgi:glutamate/tyrosine decarboxylase-like PLP-dependent enzyme
MAGQLVGRRAYGLHAEQQVAMTERFVRELTATGDWKLVTPVDTAIAAVRYVGRTDGQTARRPTAETDAMQDRIVQRVLATRRHWISPTTTVGTRAIRVMVISYLTEWHHLEELLAAMRSAAAEEA